MFASFAASLAPLAVQYYSSLLVFRVSSRLQLATLLVAELHQAARVIFCSVSLSKIQSQLRIHFNTFCPRRAGDIELRRVCQWMWRARKRNLREIALHFD
jgi:hypothetical protein